MVDPLVCVCTSELKTLMLAMDGHAQVSAACMHACALMQCMMIS